MSSKTILIVDDDPDVRFVFGAILNLDGYHVVEAADGEEAIQLARRVLPDLVLMDVAMPLLDGLAAAGALRADERTRHIPLVALTGEPLDEPDEAELVETLFHSRLWKPIHPKHLKEHIRGIIGDP